MSTAIVKYKDAEDPKFYCKTESYPAGLGFQLLKLTENEKPEYLPWIMCQGDRFEQVSEVPQDIEYEYVIDTEKNEIVCRECWWAKDKSYHGGGWRHGATYDLKEWREKMQREEEYTYRLPEYWK